MPTASVPHTPLTRCTESAPTGSSTRSLSNPKTARTARTPAMPPIATAPTMEAASQPAVMATSPARVPLTIMLKSGFFCSHQEAKSEVIVPVAAARFVVRAIWAMARPSAAIVLPGLKPNHPSQRMSPPSVTLVMLWPRIVCGSPRLVNFPNRGPRMIAPVRAAQPPIEWTTVDPAKSCTGVASVARKPPPQIQ